MNASFLFLIPSQTTLIKMRSSLVCLLASFLLVNQALAISKRGIAWPWFEKHPVSDFYANGKVGWVSVYFSFIFRLSFLTVF